MAKEPIKIMISSSVYGAQSLLRQTYATLLGFGYNVICSPIGTLPVNPKKANLTNCLEAVEECDAFLGFIRPIHGSGRDSKKDKSVTHMELEKAIEMYELAADSLSKKPWSQQTNHWVHEYHYDFEALDFISAQFSDQKRVAAYLNI